jgi:hypothetical protein
MSLCLMPWRHPHIDGASVWSNLKKAVVGKMVFDKTANRLNDLGTFKYIEAARRQRILKIF